MLSVKETTNNPIESGFKLDGDYSDKELAMLETHSYQCPYCGEAVEALLDLSAGDQHYIEDCSVCCRPVVLDLHTDGCDWQLAVAREDD